MSNINESKEGQEAPGYVLLAGGLTLLVWTIASSIIVGGLCQSSGDIGLGYAVTGAIIIVFLTPIGALLFASGLVKILRDTRT
jgi:hypothetical protein